MKNLNTKLNLGDTIYDVEEIEKFILRLFKGKDLRDIEIIPEDKSVKIILKDSLNKRITKPLCPPNIKEGTILSYYFEQKNLCLKPLRNGTFILRKGCSHNKTVRPLFSLEKKLIKNGFNKKELFLNEEDYNKYIKGDFND